MLKKHIVAKYL